MTRFSYQGNNYQELLAAFAGKNNMVPAQQTVPMPEGLATGYSRSFDMGNGLSVLIADCTYTADFVLDRQASENDFFILQFNDIRQETYHVNTTGDLLPETSDQSEIIFTGSRHQHLTLRKQGARVISVKVIISASWMKNLGDEHILGELEGLLEEKNGFTYRIAMHPEIKSLLHRSVEAVRKGGLDALYAENRILLMIEKFFLYLNNKCSAANKERLKAEIRERLKAVEQLLEDKIECSKPSLNELARVAAMSPTRLKKLFREEYGQPLFTYYRHKKMSRAALLIKEKGISTREAARIAGYTNTSHFITAFLKETGNHPETYKPTNTI